MAPSASALVRAGTSLARPASKFLAGLSGDKNAGGFDVALDDAFGVGGIEGVGDCDGELQPEIGLERFTGDAVLRGPSRYSITMKGWPFCSLIS
jgi:hypothetical protein